ncbi:hypothetical protein KBTX_02678 [wastewater metagenome]|uniref:Uncharacterized protein n=2 Tax=unclassified sequences TaxID=12908 RepID=A0A5B8RCI4_9ZZZZ|nr:hypothetical protein KBTEX_02678 [uncultured organism]
MTTRPDNIERVQFLARVVQRESDHLVTTDRRVFVRPFSTERARDLDNDIDEA